MERFITVPPTSDDTSPDAPVQQGCEHNYKETAVSEPLALKDGEKRFVCSKCRHTYSQSIPATRSIKIFAIGNSFTEDSVWHLWNICKDGGAENVVVGDLYIGNCTLDKHWDNIKNSNAAYRYYKNTDGSWKSTENYTLVDALKDEKWDYIVLHQTSGSAGQTNTFCNLNNIIDFVNSNKTNPEAKIIWHMSWAYQSDLSPEKGQYAEFSKYNYDQMTMYNALKARVNEIILPNKNIAAVIPSGTAIQNLRTSYVGDNVTRDGYHLNKGFGRYTAALTWYGVLTGGSIDIIDYVPKEFPEVQSYLPVLKESAKNAISNPYSETYSKYPAFNI